jgi:hypothetical protein
MSDFKTLNDFRKGSYRKFPYQDPTYLSFALLFDWFDEDKSPLLTGKTERYLKKLADSTGDSYYNDRLQDLIAFKRALHTINIEMPWYWNSIKGLERLHQIDPANNYWGGDDAKLEIETLESLNLPISGLMHLYRKAIFDDRKWHYIVPSNLRNFRMWIYVTEIRSIQVNTSTKVGGIPSKLNKDAVSGFPGNFKPSIDVQNENSEIMGTAGRPYFMMSVSYCKFDLATGTNTFADLSKNPDSVASNSITITYEKVDNVEARVLNGIIEPQEYTKNQLSPAPDSEFFEASSKTPLDFAKDKINGKIDEVSARAIEGAKQLAEEKKRELIQMARDKTINRIPTFENVYSNFIRAIDNATDVQQVARDLGNVIPTNIANVGGGTVRQALDRGASNAVRNLGNVFD